VIHMTMDDRIRIRATADKRAREWWHAQDPKPTRAEVLAWLERARQDAVDEWRKTQIVQPAPVETVRREVFGEQQSLLVPEHARGETVADTGETT